MCRIGQKNRCDATGCEWKKVFGQKCSVSLSKTEERYFTTKIKTAGQDDWIKKIKTLK